MLNSAKHEFFIIINVKMPTIVGILTFMCRKKSILGISEPEKKLNFLRRENVKKYIRIRITVGKIVILGGNLSNLWSHNAFYIPAGLSPLNKSDHKTKDLPPQMTILSPLKRSDCTSTQNNHSPPCLHVIRSFLPMALLKYIFEGCSV